MIIRTVITLDYMNDKVVSGRSHRLAQYGNPELAFTDVNILELIPHPSWQHVDMRSYKEKSNLFPEQYNFTIFNNVRKHLMGELNIELYRKRLRWTKPQTYFGTPGYQVVLEIIQNPHQKQIQLNTSTIP